MLTELTNNIIKVKNNITGKYYNVKAANDKEANLLASMSKEALYKNRLRNLNATLYSMKPSEYLKNCEPKGLYYINDLRQYKAINKNIINNLYDKKVISELQRDIYLKINKEDGIK
jgi:hypothetical protein